MSNSSNTQHTGMVWGQIQTRTKVHYFLNIISAFVGFNIRFAFSPNRMSFTHTRGLHHVWHKQSAHIRIEFWQKIVSSSLYVCCCVFAVPMRDEVCQDLLTTCASAAIVHAFYILPLYLTFRMRYLGGLWCTLNVSPRSRALWVKRQAHYTYLIINFSVFFSWYVFKHPLRKLHSMWVACPRLERNSQQR